VDVDATEFLAARSAINAKKTEQPVSLLALLARFALLGLSRYPELNARVEPEEIVIPGYAGSPHGSGAGWQPQPSRPHWQHVHGQ
jgi:pyruvate/2-oxoglutarate dehydrogenase complex dihydrolipoamide acyltransferase (E2) component